MVTAPPGGQEDRGQRDSSSYLILQEAQPHLLKDTLVFLQRGASIITTLTTRGQTGLTFSLAAFQSACLSGKQRRAQIGLVPDPHRPGS